MPRRQGLAVPEFSMRAISLSTGFQSFLRRQPRAAWAVVWLLGLLLGGGWLVWQSMERSRNAFETDARIAHRLLSQRAVQHEAVLATLVLMQPALDVRLPAIYPQFMRMWRRVGDAARSGDSTL